MSNPKGVLKYEKGQNLEGITVAWTNVSMTVVIELKLTLKYFKFVFRIPLLLRWLGGGVF